MSQKTSSYLSSNGTDIFYRKWETSEKARGIVQIAHGMAEHSERYDDFAQTLTQAGFHVYANDHRGHGLTAKETKNLGFFAEQNGWELVVDDLFELTKLSKAEHPNLPLFLLGHSMGSYLSRRYIQKYGDELQGVILSGTGSPPKIMTSIGRMIAIAEGKVKGKRTRSHLMDKLSFGQFNQKFAPTRTSFDWLTRDIKQVDQFIKDPYCGEVSTAGFFADLLGGIGLLDHPEHLRMIPKDLLFIYFLVIKTLLADLQKGFLKHTIRIKNADHRP